MISEIDIRDMRDIIIDADMEALVNGNNSPFKESDYKKLMRFFDELIKERQPSKIPRLFLPLWNWK